MFNRDRLAYVVKMDRALSGSEKLVLMMLGTYAAPAGEVYVDRRRIAEESSLHENTVSGCITALADKGWLQPERGRHAYRLLVRDPEEVLAGAPPSPSRAIRHRLELTELEATRVLSLTQEKEQEMTALLTSNSRIAQRRQQEMTADIDLLGELQQKFSRFLATYDWRGRSSTETG